MSPKLHRRLADTSAVLSALLLATAGTLRLLSASGAALDGLLAGTAVVIGFGGFGAVGWLLWRRLPQNPIGWCFSLAALSAAVAVLARTWATLAVTGHAEMDPLARACAMVDTHGWVFTVTLAVVLPLLLLPNGHLPSPRWRWAAPSVVVACVVGAVGLLTEPGAIDQARYAGLSNPMGSAAWGPVSDALATAGLLGLLCGLAAGVVALVRRYRSSAGVERQQLRWVAVGGCCALAGIAFSTASQDPGLRGVVAGIGGVLGMSALPACIGVAALRYRLYDLGRVVSRTVSYALLTALLLGVYLGSVTTAAQLLPDGSSLAVAGSTLAAAAAFQPLRRRVQAAVDRRFNRARYDADRTVEAFTRRLRDEVDLDAVRTDLLGVVNGTLQPASVGLWLRGDAR
jgi:hypothetical protein